MPGARAAIKVMHKNPNPGGQCACSPNSKIMDCKPPYCVFVNSESMNVRAPNFVVGSECMRAGVTKMHPTAFKVKTEVVEVQQTVDVEAIIAKVRAALPTPDAA